MMSFMLTTINFVVFIICMSKKMHVKWSLFFHGNLRCKYESVKKKMDNGKIYLR